MLQPLIRDFKTHRKPLEILWLAISAAQYCFLLIYPLYTSVGKPNTHMSLSIFEALCTLSR